MQIPGKFSKLGSLFKGFEW